MNIWENIKERWLLLALLSAAGILYISLFFTQTVDQAYAMKYQAAYVILYALLFLVVLLFPKRLVEGKVMPLLEWVIKYRYLVAGILFVLLVAFKIHGSSMNCLDVYFGETEEQGSNKIVGVPRAIRSDEWFVNTEYHFAQVNQENAFLIMNENIGMDGQNMLLACNSPVSHITLIGKPQTWGYFFLDIARGFSWFWWFRLFALLLGAFELSYILTRKNKLLAVAGMLILGLASAMMWWQSASIMDLMIAGQWMFVSMYYFLHLSKVKHRIGMTAVFVVSSISYAISLYPAMQVSFGYLIMILALYYLIHDRKKIKWDKYSTILFAAAVLLIGITLGMFLKDTWQDIMKVMNTAYPGKRELVTGTTSLLQLFYYLFTLLLPFRNIPFSNNCEVSAFTAFVPVVLVLLGIYVFRKREQKEHKGLLILLGIYVLFILSMCVFQYPQMILKVTLFSFTTMSKNLLMAEIAILYMLLILLGELQGETLIKNAKQLLGIGAVAAVCYFLILGRIGGKDYVGTLVLVPLAVVCGLMEMAALKNKYGMWIMTLLTTVGISSLCVNPVVMGVDSVTNSDFITTVKEIDAQESGEWIILDTMVQQNVMAANGIHVINATQYEPNMEYWSQFDKKHQYEEVYNRYAHVMMDLTEKKTSFEVISGDVIQVNLSYKDLEKSGVDYIVTAEKLQEDNVDGTVEQIAYCEKNKMYIYKLAF